MGKAAPLRPARGRAEDYDSAIEQVKLADKLGFGTAWFVEHHFRGGRSHCPAPEVVIGALSQVTENIRLGFGVTLTPHPFRHPVLNAERIATADLLSRGRVEWGTGRSTPLERIAFGVKDEESRAQWQEAIEIIVKAWEQEHLAVDTPFVKFPALPRGDWEPPQGHHAQALSGPAPAVLGGVRERRKRRAGCQARARDAEPDDRSPVETWRSGSLATAKLSKDAVPLTRVVNNRVAPYTLVHCAPSMAEAEKTTTCGARWRGGTPT